MLGGKQHDTVALGVEMWVEDPRLRGMAVVEDGTIDEVGRARVWSMVVFVLETATVVAHTYGPTKIKLP